MCECVFADDYFGVEKILQHNVNIQANIVEEGIKINEENKIKIKMGNEEIEQVDTALPLMNK